MKIIFYSTHDNRLAKWVAYNYFDIIPQKNLTQKIKDIFIKGKYDPKNNFHCINESKSNLQVIALGCYGEEQVLLNLIPGLNNLFAINEKIILINIDIFYNYFIHLGLFAAVNLKLKKLGLLLLERGIKQEMPKIKKVIKKTKERIIKI